MKATNTSYHFENSLSRIDEILGATDGSYKETEHMPNRGALSYSNGY